MLAHFDVASSEFPGRHPDAFPSGGVFNPQKILWQQFTKAPVNLTDALGFDSVAARQAAGINPLLNGDMRLGFELQIALAAIVAVVVLKGALDVYRVRVVTF